MCVALVGVVGCGDAPDAAPGEEPGEVWELPPDPRSTWAAEVVRFTPGEGAGYGQDDVERAVLGAPSGRGDLVGSLDVLSLGVGGEVVLGFAEAIEDGPGVDLVVFENAFWVQGDKGRVFAELGEVAVSEDGEEWSVFPCVPDEPEPGPSWPGCAGWTPTASFEPGAQEALVWEESGGDGFDLEVVGLARARYVRIRDLSETGDAPTAGFDLDAVGAVRR
jgi:hypothetical protein